MTGPSCYVLDTGPLSHFAKAQWLGPLKMILGDAPVVIPDVVAAELRAGSAHHPHLIGLADRDWIDVVPLDSAEALTAFVRYEQRLVGPDGRNVGECGVLALTEVTAGAVAVLDDRVAVRAASEQGLPVRRTLGLLCDTIRGGHLSVAMVSALADDLIEHDYRLPFGRGGFARWWLDNYADPPPAPTTR